MATGYTHPVADGTCADLRTFALDCARAFGALVSLRDAPRNAEIPTTIEPDVAYHDERLRDLRDRQRVLADMTEADAAREMASERGAYVARAAQTNAEVAGRIDRMRSMLEKVDAWKPPTPEHDNLKAFMRSQLRESIQWEAPAIGELRSLLTPAEWLAERRTDVSRTIARLEADREAEIRRAAERTAWIQSLLGSL